MKMVPVTMILKIGCYVNGDSNDDDDNVDGDDDNGDDDDNNGKLLKIL